jgi:hypothetical protein
MVSSIYMTPNRARRFGALALRPQNCSGFMRGFGGQFPRVRSGIEVPRKDDEMRPNARWRGAACVSLLLALSMTLLEPAAFAQNADKGEDRTNPATADGAVSTPPPQTLPSRASIQGTPTQLPTSSAPVRTVQPPNAPAQDSKKRNGWKWIVIAAAGAGVTAYFLANRNSPPPETVITLGQPVVGQPQ